MKREYDDREMGWIAVFALIGVVTICASITAALAALLWLAFSFGPVIGCLAIVVIVIAVIAGCRESV